MCVYHNCSSISQDRCSVWTCKENPTRKRALNKLIKNLDLCFRELIGQLSK